MARARRYAFWKYDQFPFWLGGQIEDTNANGNVSIRGYGNLYFSPEFILSGDRGEKLVRNFKTIDAQFRSLRNSLAEMFNEKVSKMIAEAKKAEGEAQNAKWESRPAKKGPP